MLRESEDAKVDKHVLNGATMVPLVMTSFGNWGPSAQGVLQSSADVAPLELLQRDVAVRGAEAGRQKAGNLKGKQVWEASTPTKAKT